MIIDRRKLVNIIFIIILLLLVTIGITKCIDSRKFNTERESLILNDSKMQTKIKDIRNSAGRQIQVYDLVAIQANDLLSSKSAEVQQLRQDLRAAGEKKPRVISSVTVGTTTRDSIQIAVHDTIVATDTGLQKLQFSYRDKWIDIMGENLFRHINEGFVLDTINLTYNIRNSSSETHYMSGGFLKKKHLRLMVTQDNPHTTIDRVQSYDIAVPKKWYEKTYLHIGVGILIGGYLVNGLR